VKQYGIHDFTLRFVEWFDTKKRSNIYHKISSRFLPTEEELSRQRKTHFPYEPLISIVVPAFETDPVFLCQLVETVLEQSYSNLELCIADGSNTDIVRTTLQKYNDTRIQYTKLSKNAGISENTNEGFQNAHGEYIALLDHDDLLTKNALFEMVQVLNTVSPMPDMVYSDEDKIIANTGVLANPAFKPDFNEAYIRCNNYVCHFLIFSKKLLDRVGGLDSQYDGAQDFEFVLRCRAAGASIAHVPKILYHWRIHPASTAFDPGSKLYAYENGARAIEKYLVGKGEPGKASLTKDLGYYTIDYELSGHYQVTVLAHSNDQILAMKDLQPADSRIQVAYELVSAIDTETLQHAAGDYIVVTAPTALPLTKDWLINMLKLAQHKNTGMVAVKGLNSRKRIVSCGITYDKNGEIASFYEGLPAIYRGYCHRADDVIQNVSAASLSFAMLRKDAIAAYNVIDTALASHYRDVDYCFGLTDHGYEILLNTNILAYIPAPVIGRGVPADFLERHTTRLLKGDPYYSPNVLLKKGRFLLK
jgi:GT2 family glycosyltransferase